MVAEGIVFGAATRIRADWTLTELRCLNGRDNAWKFIAGAQTPAHGPPRRKS
jgi:hypothetical protein